jgi:outer membrane protein with beta-barrel domain
MCVLTRVLIFIGLLGGASMLHAQASATASRTGDLKIGGGYTTAASDYGGRYSGGAAYFDYDFTAHLGVEGEFHFVKGGGSIGLYEKTYEIGGRYFRTYGKLVPYAKVLYGRGVFNFPAYVPGGPHPNLAYNMFAGGAGVDYKALPYLYVRGDFEYQDWFSFPPSGLSPSLLTVGVAYHFR